MTLAYFGQLQPQQGPLKDLAELQPYEVPWSAVGVHICTGRVANSQYMYVLNASIVALCIADKKQVSFIVMFTIVEIYLLIQCTLCMNR